MKRSLQLLNLALAGTATLMMAGTATEVQFSKRNELKPVKAAKSPAQAYDVMGCPIKTKMAIEPVKNYKVVPSTRAAEEQEDTYNSHINSQEEFDKYIVIDCNGDGNTWSYTNFTGMASCQGGSIAADDWLISPGIELQEGERYVVTLNIKNADGALRPERFEAKFGNSRTVEGMTMQVFEPTVLTNSTLEEKWQYFTAPATGTYYLGIHHISDPDMNYMSVQDIVVSAPGAVGLPTEIAYDTKVLYEADFSNIGGTWESPVDVTDYTQTHEGETYRLKEPEGWAGYGAAKAGDCMVVLASEVGTDKGEIIPQRVDCEDYKMINLTIGGKIHEFSPRSIELNGFEFFKGLVMYSNRDFSEGWGYSGTEISDIEFIKLTKDNENSWTYKLDLPETAQMATYDADGNYVNLGEQAVNELTVRLSGYWGSDVALTEYKVVGMKELLPKPTNLTYSGYDNDGMTISWDGCEEAEGYVVVIYDHQYAQWGGQGPDNLYLLSRSQTLQTSETSMHIDIDTTQDAVLLEVFAIKDGKRSESSGVIRIFEVAEPTLVSAEFNVNSPETALLKWEGTELAHMINVIARKGETYPEGNPDLEIATLDFSTINDVEMGSNGGATGYLDVLAGGWTIDGNWGFENGVAVCGNWMWGYWPVFTIGSSYYDFTKVNGDIVVNTTAKSEGWGDTLVAQLYGFDPATRTYKVLYESDPQTLSSEFADYTFSIPAVDSENMQVRVVIYGYSKAYISKVAVRSSIEEGGTFYRPYFVGGLDLTANPGVTAANLPTDGLASYQFVMSSSRLELHDYLDWEGNPATVSLTQADSDFSNIIEASNNTNGVDGIMVENPSEETVEYFNLQGIRVENPTENGIYIRKAGKNIEKVIVK